MILYHFTAARLVERIKREGITLGGVLDIVKGQTVIRRGHLWLTVNANFYDQEWNSMETILYDRAEFRITVEVPTAEAHKVINWVEFCNNGGVHKEVSRTLNALGDPENWRLFKGAIPPAWFTAIDRKLLAIPHKQSLVGVSGF